MEWGRTLTKRIPVVPLSWVGSEMCWVYKRPISTHMETNTLPKVRQGQISLMQPGRYTTRNLWARRIRVATGSKRNSNGY